MPCMMIRLEDVILDGTGLLTKSQPVTTGMDFQYCCIVCLHKGVITEVILLYDLNARDFLHGDAKFSREFCMGWQIPCSVGDTKNTERVPKSLGNLTRGCQILGGGGSPMTPGRNVATEGNTTKTALSRPSHGIFV